jgi:ribonuclease R
MKFSVANLLDHLQAESAVSVQDLEKKLTLKTVKEKHYLKLALQALELVGVLSQAEQGISRINNETLIEARLRCSSKGFCFALREDGADDIYIRDHQLNHAWNGDRVLVKLTREGGRRRSPEGGVQCILERANTTVLAQVERQEEQLFALPLDDRLHASIQLEEVDANHIDRAAEAVVEVELDRFPVGQYPAQGHVRRSLSITGGGEADLELLLARHRLDPTGFSGRVSLKSPAVVNREDLTALPTILLQPWSCENSPASIAVSLESGAAGHRLWVHVPDVAERLSIDGPMERWLRQKGEAICIGSKWLTLLPPALQKAAALSVGVENSALSVALDFNGEGELLSYHFCRSSLICDGQLDSKSFEAFLNRKPKARTTPVALKALKEHLPLLEELQALVQLLRQQRLGGGSLDLDLAIAPLEGFGEQALGIPDQRRNGWFATAEAVSPMGWLRELVRPCEQALGRHLAALELPGLFLSQGAPDSADLNDLVKLAVGLDVPLELGADGNAPAAASLAAAFQNTERARVLQQQLREATKTVQLTALPEPNALAAEPLAYAPWCFPTLHYSAIWNQMLLITLLTEAKDRPSVRHKKRIDLSSDSCHGKIEWLLLTASQLAPFQEAIATGLTNRLNNRSRFAEEVEADALALARARQAESLVGQTLAGVISGIQSYGFFVELPPTQVEGLVHVSSLKDDWYEYRSRQHRLVGRKNRRTYKLGDPVEVEVLKVDVLRHQIDLAVIQPEIDSSGFELEDEGEDEES